MVKFVTVDMMRSVDSRQCGEVLKKNRAEKNEFNQTIFVVVWIVSNSEIYEQPAG